MPVVINGTSGISSPGETVTGPFVINSNGNDQFRFTDGTQNLYMDTDTNGVSVSGGPGQTLGGMYIQNSNGSVSLFTGNNLRLTVDSSGRVTMPSQPMFIAMRTNNTNINTTQVMVFNSAVTNVGSHYNISTGRFTAPIAGIYEFSVGMLHRFQSGAGTLDVYPRKNGAVFLPGNSRISYSQINQAQEQMTGGNWIVSLAANDTMEVYLLLQNTNTDVYGSDINFYCGTLVG